MLGKKQLYPYICGWRWEVIGGGARGKGGARSGKPQPVPCGWWEGPGSRVRGVLENRGWIQEGNVTVGLRGRGS